MQEVFDFHSVSVLMSLTSKTEKNMQTQGNSHQNIVALLLLLFLFGASPWAFHSFAQEIQDGDKLSTNDVVSQKDNTITADEEGGEWVVAAYLGGASTSSSSLKITQPSFRNQLTFENVRFTGRSFDPPLYYGLRGGYYLPQLTAIGVEAEFIHLKVYSDPQQRIQVTGNRRGESINGELILSQIVQQYSISHGVNLLLFNLAGRHRLQRSPGRPRGRLILTGRFGIGPTLPHTESTVDGVHQEQYEVGRIGWQLAGGAEINLWRGLYALGEYKFTRTSQKGKIFSGEAESLLRTHHGIFGLSYHF